MAFSLSTEELDEVERKEGGKGLRAKLEEVLAELADERKASATLRAEKVLRDKGLTHVSADDLAGVAEKDLEAKAQELEDAAIEQRRDVLREVLEGKGYTGDELTKAVDEMLAPTGADQESVQSSSMHDRSGQGGLPIPSKPAIPEGTQPGRGTLEAHFASQK